MSDIESMREKIPGWKKILVLIIVIGMVLWPIATVL